MAPPFFLLYSIPFPPAACFSEDPGEGCVLTDGGYLAGEEGPCEEREAEGGVCEAAAARGGIVQGGGRGGKDGCLREAAHGVPGCHADGQGRART